MQSLGKFKLNPPLSPLKKGGLRRVFGLGITLLLLLAVACGTAATPTPAPTAIPTPRPTVSQSATPAPLAAPTRAATATPTLAAAPKVHPGKVTWMIGSWANERFDGALGTVGQSYTKLIHGFLISSDVKDGRLVIAPGIATAWEISSDGLTWTLTIRKGAKFHNGAEVSAEDVLWSLRHSIGPQAPDYLLSSQLVALAKITVRIEQTGPDRISVTSKEPIPDFALTNLSTASSGGFITILPKRATLHDLNEEAAYDKNPIGAGVMRLVKHVPADSMTFERFADYFLADKRPNFTQLDLRLVPEEATRVAALRAGDADIAPVTLASRKQVEAGGGRLVFGEEGTHFWIRLLGCWKPQFPCSDKRVRQALAYAIDKKLMQDQLYGGPAVMQLKGWSAVSPSTVGYSPELDPFPYDPQKARQLLAEAGYPGGKGFGKLIINTWVATATPLMSESAQLGAEYWRRELGLDVEVKVGDEAALQKATRLTEDLHGQIYWRDNDNRPDFAGILRGFYGNPDRYDKAHNNPELFALVAKATSVIDPIEREKILNSAYRRMRDEAYDITLGYFNIPWGVGPRILTWQPYPLANYPSGLHTINLK